MGDKGEKGAETPDPAGELEAAIGHFTDTLGGDYDGTAISGAFAGAEAALQGALETKQRDAQEVFGTLKGWADEVVEKATANADGATASIFGARAQSYATTLGLLAGTIEPGKSNTVTQPVSGAKK